MKYTVSGIISASKFLATVEAESEEEAIRKVEEDSSINTYVDLCHQCSDEVNLGDIYKYEASLQDEDEDGEQDGD